MFKKERQLNPIKFSTKTTKGKKTMKDKNRNKEQG